MQAATQTTRPAPHAVPMHALQAKRGAAGGSRFGFACNSKRARASVSVCTWIVDAPR